MKYKKQSKINEMTDFGRSLGLTCRSSRRGLSIIGPSETKFFDGSVLLKDDSECIKFIKREADPSLQTKFL